MQFLVKKTTELTKEEISQITSLFNEVFEKNRTNEEFINQNTQNPFGYSFHSLMFDNGFIVGHNSGNPSYYLVNGQRQMFVCNVDTMIKKGYRGIDNFFELINNAIDCYKKNGATVLYGFPNDQSYPLLKGIGLMEDVGKLETYCLPYRIGGIKHNLRFLNMFSKLFCLMWLKISIIFASNKVQNYRIEKESNSYNETRYKRSDGNYSIIYLNEFSFVYKLLTYEGIRTVFIIDIDKKSAKNFAKATNYIISKESRKFDLLLYVGSLSFGFNGLVKFPRKYEPKHFNFTATNISGQNQNVLFNLKNWDVNLSNYDLI